MMKHPFVSILISILSFLTGSLWSRGWQQEALPVVGVDCECPPPIHCPEPSPKSVIVPTRLPDAIQQHQRRRFPPSVENIAAGAARSNAKDFAATFDTGIPYDDESVEDVLILYSTPSSLPLANRSRDDAMKGNGDIPKLSPLEATAQCDLLNVLHVQRPNQELRQCLAILGHHVDSSIHSKTFLRTKPQMNDNTKRVPDTHEPLRHVGQGVRATGDDFYWPPQPKHTEFHYDMMRVFLSHYNVVVEEVKAIVQRIAKDKTVVAIATNRGYSDLLVNFVCQTRARGLDLSHVLVFATDAETKQLAEGFGLTAYYSDKIFASLPSEGAAGFADGTWRKMVYAQGLCVQILSQIGYNFLFQDVDVFWYKDPLEYFQHQSHEVDIYLMEDGARWRYYAPYGANTGFYYVRANARTRHLFTNFFSLSDNAMQRNDQSVMNMLLHLHSNQYGLHVKVVSRDEPLFLGGFHYSGRRGTMKQLLKGEIDPYTYHAHWSEPADKRRYLRQMGLWYLNAHCSNTTVTLPRTHNVSSGSVTAPLVGQCCSAEPLLECFYRDMPSKEPCKDSPAKHNNRGSFW